MPPQAASSKRGKENAPLKAKAAVAVDEPAEDFDAIMDEGPVKPVKKVGRPSKSAKKQAEAAVAADEMEADEERASSKASQRSDLSRSSKSGDELQRVQAECERLRRERDAWAKQFEELSNLRNSGAEALLLKFKEAAETKAKAQLELIRRQEALYEKQTAKVKSLEETVATLQASVAAAEAASAPPKFDAKLERMGSRELRDEVHKLRDAVTAKDGEIATIQREYDEEVAHSRKLQESQAMRRSAEPPAKPAVNEVLSLAVRLYEELTGLDILDASARVDPKSGDERTYKCIQTTGGRNYTFKMRIHNTYEKSRMEWAKVVQVTPTDMDKETDSRLIKRLGPFCEPFELERKQLATAYGQLKARMDPEGQYEDPE